MSNIKKINKNHPAFIAEELAKHEMDIKEGDRFIEKHGYIHIVEKIRIEVREKWEDEEGNELKKPIEYNEVIIDFGYWETDEETGKKEFNRQGSYDLERFKEEYIKSPNLSKRWSRKPLHRCW